MLLLLLLLLTQTLGAILIFPPAVGDCISVNYTGGRSQGMQAGRKLCEARYGYTPFSKALKKAAAIAHT